MVISMKQRRPILVVILAVSLMAILIIVSYNVYLNSLDHVHSDELSLVASLDELDLEQPSIKISATLENIGSHTRWIDSWFELDRLFLDINLTGPDNTTLYLLYGMTDRVISHTIFSPGESLVLTIDLVSEIVTFISFDGDGNYSQSPWDWNTPGNYSFYFIYSGVNPSVISNTAHFVIP